MVFNNFVLSIVFGLSAFRVILFLLFFNNSFYYSVLPSILVFIFVNKLSFCESLNVETELTEPSVFIKFLSLCLFVFLIKIFLYFKKKIKIKIWFYAIAFLEVTSYSLTLFLTNQEIIAVLIFITYFIFCILLENHSVFEKLEKKLGFANNNKATTIVDYVSLISAALSYYVIQNNFGIKIAIVKTVVFTSFLIYFQLIKIWLLFCFLNMLITNNFCYQYKTNVFYKQRINRRLSSEVVTTTRIVFDSDSPYYIHKRNYFKTILTKAAEATHKFSNGVYGTVVGAVAYQYIQGEGESAINKDYEIKHEAWQDLCKDKINQANVHKVFTNITLPPEPRMAEPSAAQAFNRGIKEIASSGQEKFINVSRSTSDFIKKSLEESSNNPPSSFGGFGDC